MPGDRSPFSHRDDLDLLLSARNGRAEAARELLDRHGESMMKTAWSVLGRYGGTEGDDAVQEALLAALTTDALPTGDVGAWLRAVTARKALDGMRRRGRRAEQPFPAGEESLPSQGASHSPAREHLLALRQALGQLSPRERAVLTLVDLEGFSMSEAAEALGTTRAAMKWRAVRARRKLQDLLEAVPPPSSKES